MHRDSEGYPPYNALTIRTVIAALLVGFAGYKFSRDRPGDHWALMILIAVLGTVAGLLVAMWWLFAVRRSGYAGSDESAKRALVAMLAGSGIVACGAAAGLLAFAATHDRILEATASIVVGLPLAFVLAQIYERNLGPVTPKNTDRRGTLLYAFLILETSLQLVQIVHWLHQKRDVLSFVADYLFAGLVSLAPLLIVSAYFHWHRVRKLGPKTPTLA